MSTEILALAGTVFTAVCTAIATLWRSLQKQHNENKGRIAKAEAEIARMTREDRATLLNAVQTSTKAIEGSAEAMQRMAEAFDRLAHRDHAERANGTARPAGKA
jgi:hypothetical protein